MKVEIPTTNSIKKIVANEVGDKFNRLEKQLNKLNDRIIDLEQIKPILRKR